MVNRTQTARRSLLTECTSLSSLRRAWDRVKFRVLFSRDAETRRAASEFLADVDTKLRRLQRQLRNGSFQFERQKGVLKRSRRVPGAPLKEPRPIVVAPVANRIIQRAILDCLQSKKPDIRRKIGAIPSILATPSSVGGLPGKGVPEAVSIIRNAIEDGAVWYLRSDLKKFFQRIDKDEIHAFMAANVTDEEFLRLFRNALKTELANEEEVRDFLTLFPLQEIGVPQGSSLSALVANILLRDFDLELNTRGITCVRYLDDFVILGRSQRAVELAWRRGAQILTNLGLEYHDPAARSAKASKGHIREGFDFLSYHFSSAHLYPSNEAQRKLIQDLTITIRDAKKAIIESRGAFRRAEPRFVQSLALIDRKVRGWGDAFSSTNDGLVFSRLDKEIDRLVVTYRRWFQSTAKGWRPDEARRAYGIALLSDTSRTGNSAGERRLATASFVGGESSSAVMPAPAVASNVQTSNTSVPVIAE